MSQLHIDAREKKYFLFKDHSVRRVLGTLKMPNRIVISQFLLLRKPDTGFGEKLFKI